MQQPPAIHCDHLGSLFLGGVTTNREGIPPSALAPTVACRPADIDFVRPDLVRLPSSCVHHNRHGLISDQSDGAHDFGAAAKINFCASRQLRSVTRPLRTVGAGTNQYRAN